MTRAQMIQALREHWVRQAEFVAEDEMDVAGAVEYYSQLSTTELEFEYTALVVDC